MTTSQIVEEHAKSSLVDEDSDISVRIVGL
jgi:hypothetical protein